MQRETFPNPPPQIPKLPASEGSWEFFTELNKASNWGGIPRFTRKTSLIKIWGFFWSPSPPPKRCLRHLQVREFPTPAPKIKPLSRFSWDIPTFSSLKLRLFPTLSLKETRDLHFLGKAAPKPQPSPSFGGFSSRSGKLRKLFGPQIAIHAAQTTRTRLPPAPIPQGIILQVLETEKKVEKRF